MVHLIQIYSKWTITYTKDGTTLIGKMTSSQNTDTIDSKEAKREDVKSMRSPLLASKQ